MDAEYYEKLRQESLHTGRPIFHTPPSSTPKDPYPNVPAELKALPQWLMWKLETTRDGKPTKIPYQTSGHHAQTSEHSTWTDYKTACHAFTSTQEMWSGIGFVFTADDPLCGIDLDDCLDNGQLKPWATTIVDRLKAVAYGEVSPSGNGIKFWTFANLPTEAKKRAYITAEGNVCPQGSDTEGGIETYDTLRYFTVTGRGKGEIKDGQIVMDWLCEKYLKSQSEARNTRETPKSPISNLSANEVIDKIRKSKQAHKFDALMNGNTTGYVSDSEADLALCGVIAFWTQDETVIDAIFRQSKLMRDKWDVKHRADGASYGKMTIEKALNELKQTYTPPKPKTLRRWNDGFYQRRAKRRRYR